MARRRSRRLLILLAALVIIGGGGAFLFKVKSRGAVEIDPLHLATIERGDLAKSVVATGRIEPISKVEIKSKANGIIKELKVDIGAIVTEGQVLAELDKDDLQAQLRQAKAAETSARANLKAAIAALEKNKVEAEGPDVPFAHRNAERNERLFKAGIVPPQALDDAQSALELAMNRQNIARSQLIVSQANIAKAEADVAQATAAVDHADQQLSYSTLRSPIRGMVLSRDVELGSPVSSILNMGSAATLVMTLGDISQVFVRGKVDEADIGVVKLGQPARIKVETFKDRQFEGHVTQISPLGVDKDNVITFAVKVSVSNPGELRANMTANAEIVLEEHKGTLIIPESAIIYDTNRKPTVQIPNPAMPNGRESRAIKVGVSNGTKTEVLEGLTEGQKVIVQ